MSYALGVDLGTTWTAAAIHGDGEPQPLTLSGRGFAMPSVVAREGDAFVVGEAAERRLRTAPTSGAREAKRRLGDPAPFVLDGAPYGAEVLLGALLAHAVAVATETQGEAPAQVILTHPATWGEYKLDLLRAAARSADVDDVQLLSEPEAAAAHYASLGRVAPDDTVAVYDFGGGTFDAAVVRRTEAGFELLGEPQGLDRLGGVDLDQAVLAHVDQALGGAFQSLDRSDPAVVAALVRLREDCTTAKEALSSDTEATIAVALPGLNTQVRLTREEMEAMIRPRLAETTNALRAAVTSAGLELDAISGILLVGGTARIPLVAEFVGGETGRPVVTDAHPKLVVALGASTWTGARQVDGPAGDLVEAAVDSDGKPVEPTVVPVVVPIVATAGDKAAAAAAAAATPTTATDPTAPAARGAGATATTVTAAPAGGGGTAAASATTAPGSATTSALASGDGGSSRIGLGAAVTGVAAAAGAGAYVLHDRSNDHDGPDDAPSAPADAPAGDQPEDAPEAAAPAPTADPAPPSIDAFDDVAAPADPVGAVRSAANPTFAAPEVRTAPVADDPVPAAATPTVAVDLDDPVMGSSPAPAPTAPVAAPEPTPEPEAPAPAAPVAAPAPTDEAPPPADDAPPPPADPEPDAPEAPASPPADGGDDADDDPGADPSADDPAPEAATATADGVAAPVQTLSAAPDSFEEVASPTPAATGADDSAADAPSETAAAPAASADEDDDALGVAAVHADVAAAAPPPPAPAPPPEADDTATVAPPPAPEPADDDSYGAPDDGAPADDPTLDDTYVPDDDGPDDSGYDDGDDDDYDTGPDDPTLDDDGLPAS